MEVGEQPAAGQEYYTDEGRLQAHETIALRPGKVVADQSRGCRHGSGDRYAEQGAADEQLVKRGEGQRPEIPAKP